MAGWDAGRRHVGMEDLEHIAAIVIACAAAFAAMAWANQHQS
jgi:hypothetical protein